MQTNCQKHGNGGNENVCGAFQASEIFANVDETSISVKKYFHVFVVKAMSTEVNETG